MLTDIQLQQKIDRVKGQITELETSLTELNQTKQRKITEASARRAALSEALEDATRLNQEFVSDATWKSSDPLETIKGAVLCELAQSKLKTCLANVDNYIADYPKQVEATTRTLNQQKREVEKILADLKKQQEARKSPVQKLKEKWLITS